MSGRRTLLVVGALAAISTATRAIAQNPVRLPEVKVTAEGSRIVRGIVTDTSGIPIEGADVTIPTLRRRTVSRSDGFFHFDSVPTGKYDVRARKIGYAPQVKQIKLDSIGVQLDDFELVPITTLLAAMVAHVERLGLSGVVADTSFRGLPSVMVKVMGIGVVTATDSTGAFYIPLMKPGSYMVLFGKDSFADRLVGVTMPADSGRRITVSLGQVRPRPHIEAAIIPDFNERLAWSAPGSHLLWTREYLIKMGYNWAQEAAAAAARHYGITDDPQEDCFVALNGGPSMTPIRDVTVDEIESIEFAGPSLIRGAIRGVQPTSGNGRPIGLISKTKTMIHIDYNANMGRNYKPISDANRGKRCLLVNVWTR